MSVKRKTVARVILLTTPTCKTTTWRQTGPEPQG